MSGMTVARWMLVLAVGTGVGCGSVGAKNDASGNSEAGAETSTTSSDGAQDQPQAQPDAATSDGTTPDATSPDATPPDATPPDATPPDAGSEVATADGPDAAADGPRDTAAETTPAAACDLSLPFGAPTPIAALNDPAGSTDGFWLTSDGLTAYISSKRAGSEGFDIFTARRTTLTGTFAAPTLLAPVNTVADERSPILSPDGKTLFFYRGTDKGEDIFASQRQSTLAAFPAAQVAGVINAPDVDENTGSMTSDGKILYFSSRRSGVFQIYRAAISPSGEFQAPEAVGELNASGVANGHPVISADQLTIYFVRRNQGESDDIWVARRSTPSDGFGAPAVVKELNSNGTDAPVYLSADGCTLYITSNRNRDTTTTTYEMFSATRPPR